jgi:hypothetical protein
MEEIPQILMIVEATFCPDPKSEPGKTFSKQLICCWVFHLCPCAKETEKVPGTWLVLKYSTTSDIINCGF